MSDRFEELLVNPALITLTRQRGELDCGGLRYLVVAYARFSELVIPTGAGHVSISLESNTHFESVADAVVELIEHHVPST